MIETIETIEMIEDPHPHPNKEVVVSTKVVTLRMEIGIVVNATFTTLDQDNLVKIVQHLNESLKEITGY